MCSKAQGFYGLTGMKLLEYNPSPLTPWLTVSTAQDEIAIIERNEETIFVPFEEFVSDMHIQRQPERS